MVREFSAESLVSLPRVNVDSGLALWQALRAVVAEEKKLPRFLQAAWQGVETAGTTLSKAAQTRLTDGKASSPEKRKADIVVDGAVAALDLYLWAWSKLPAELPEAQTAIAVRQALFPDGTSFLKLPFEQEWAQIERRVAMIKSEGLDKEIAKLGGTLFVTYLQQSHAAYGKALGLTAVPSVPAEPVAVREPLATLASALRRYVIKVTAYRDDEDSATGELAERLLRPLMTWASKAPRSSGEGEPVPAPTPAAGQAASP